MEQTKKVAVGNKNPSLNILNFVISGLTIWIVDTIFGGLRHQRVVRNTIFRKAPPSVVSGYGKRERLCLIIDKCRRQKLCKRVQKISAAAPLRVMASRYNPCE
jgi:hypothetical protein